MRHTIIEAIATGNPPLTRSQAYAAAFMQRIESIPEPLRKRIPQIYERSGIDFRFSCVEDYGRTAEEFEFFPPTWSMEPAPSTAQRNAKYREAAIPLAESVSKEALRLSGIEPDAVTHVIAVSCTGFFAPGLDIELVKRLGLSPSTKRTMVGFMGCYAAFNALRVADSFCQADPYACVLVVCVELCTLHFQIRDGLESAIVNGIFSDGAAACVLTSKSPEEASGRLAYVANHALLDEDSMADMTWDIGDTGFLMGLSSRVPDVLSRRLTPFLEGLLLPQGLNPEDVGFWAIHPGGRAIVEKAQEVLALEDERVEDSLEVLRLHGNMSSPTILFVLKRLLDRHESHRREGREGYASGVALSFGPGLTLEGALFKRVDAEP